MRLSACYKNDIIESFEEMEECTKLNGKCILITGSTGLIGSAIADALLVLNGEKSYGIKLYLAGREKEKLKNRFEEYREAIDYSFVKYDAEKAIEPFPDKPDYIIHAAGIANTALYATHPCEVMEATLSGCKNVLSLIRSNDAGRLVFISSSEVYGKKKSTEPYKENEYYGIDLMNPRACYPSAKAAAETMCCAYSDEYGVETVIVRPGHIYGASATENDKRASSAFPRELLSTGKITMKSEGKQMRSYCYVIDAVTAILTVMLKGKTGEAYNISNPYSIVSIRQMAEAFAEAEGGAIVTEMATREEQKGYNLMDNSSLDGSKLEALGWRGRYDMKTGAERTLEMLRYQNREE